MLQMQTQQHPMSLTQVSAQRLPEGVEFGTHPASGQLG